MPSSVKNILYFKPNFYTDENRAQAADSVSSLLYCEVIVAQTWAEMIANIDCNVGLLVMHVSVIEAAPDIPLISFFKMLDSIIRYTLAVDQFPKIAISVDSTTPRLLIDQIKGFGLAGVVPSTDFGTLEIIKANDALLHGNEYWPDHIIDQLVESPSVLPLIIYLRPTLTLGKPPPLTSEISMRTQSKFEVCETWSEFSAVLYKSPAGIMFHSSLFSELNVTVKEFYRMLLTLKHCIAPHLVMNIGVVVEKNTSMLLVNELKDNGITCIIPGFYSFGIDEVVYGVDALLRHEPYYPIHITNTILPLPKLAKTGIHLTDRQSQVLSLVCKRGLSNKKIAATLKISESTVKIHVSAILKEYGVRNRTQLVLAATSSLKA